MAPALFNSRNHQTTIEISMQFKTIYLLKYAVLWIVEKHENDRRNIINL